MKKILGAEEIDGSSNAVDTEITVYEVPSGYEAIISCLHILNRQTNTAAVIVAVTHGGAITDAFYVLFEDPVYSERGNNHIDVMIGMTLAAGDKIIVLSNIVDVNFMAFGDEVAVP